MSDDDLTEIYGYVNMGVDTRDLMPLLLPFDDDDEDAGGPSHL